MLVLFQPHSLAYCSLIVTLLSAFPLHLTHGLEMAAVGSTSVRGLCGGTLEYRPYPEVRREAVQRKCWWGSMGSRFCLLSPHFGAFQIGKLRSELEMVSGNVRVMSEMLTELVPTQIEPADLELLQVSKEPASRFSPTQVTIFFPAHMALFWFCWELWGNRKYYKEEP